MSSRGRGYGGRGSYSGGRGSSYRGSYRGSSSRGSYESRGGRGGGYSSYNNDSRYTSGSASRYNSSRDRMEDSYKKVYRSESSANYSNRDYGGRSGSPDRKRMRMERVERNKESYVQGSSSDRRSHDGGGHYGGSYGARQESYSSERRSFGGEDRRRSPNRESYRKPSGMGPPREAVRPATRPRAVRRSFRGRTMRSRASFRGAPRSRGTFTSRRYTERSLGYTRAFRSLKGRSSVKSKEDASSTEEDWDAEEKEEAVEEKKEIKIKSPKAEPEPSDGEQVDGGEDTDKEPDAASDSAPQRPRPYVHLACVHCKEKCATFAAYVKHLVSSKHRAAMSGVARRHKAQLLRMRVAQRGAQRELEAAAGAQLAARTTFCPVCRLNHRTTRHAHNLTDTHRAMKRFLMPFCQICRLTFRSPMIYEHHICSLEHLKRKASQSARRVSPKAEASGDEGMDVDLDNFMTLDSVGDVDEVEDDDSGGEKKDESSPKKPKVEINIGSEHIKKMEVWWCELCRVYLPRVEPGGTEEAEALRRHCRLRIHLGRYVQHRDTRTLRKHAERIHRQLHQQKEEDKEPSASETGDKNVSDKHEAVEETKKKLDNGADNSTASGSEDKLWADVDKDIGELLREVDPQGNEGSDDDEDLGRYDKFRKSDKKTKAGENGENPADTADAVSEKSNTENNTSV
ncbi:zinc finger protein on ecdysone puffs-like isoform X1 [Helicoverpa zea]|uniref:zinc finger protein on ecdysone puffs-like isoform X1 n=1 Tax=Helicoverpa zea TaxID=7113 RepID=UPI001F568B64|nr:zinc finger protein on ecdysone puffs-like isoform X1 [Helicoverpa zea]XP_047019848.1 zinc finger protein on ecdysone puffs-like isoform X1 [Helicoverpa zea]